MNSLKRFSFYQTRMKILNNHECTKDIQTLRNFDSFPLLPSSAPCRKPEWDPAKRGNEQLDVCLLLDRNWDCPYSPFGASRMNVFSRVRGCFVLQLRQDTSSRMMRSVVRSDGEVLPPLCTLSAWIQQGPRGEVNGTPIFPLDARWICIFATCGCWPKKIGLFSPQTQIIQFIIGNKPSILGVKPPLFWVQHPHVASVIFPWIQRPHALHLCSKVAAHLLKTVIQQCRIRSAVPGIGDFLHRSYHAIHLGVSKNRGTPKMDGL